MLGHVLEDAPLLPERAVVSVSSLMRLMNNPAASSSPTPTANTMSNSTVRIRQVSSTSTSLRGAMRNTCITCGASLMFQATITSNAASAAIGR